MSDIVEQSEQLAQQQQQQNEVQNEDQQNSGSDQQQENQQKETDSKIEKENNSDQKQEDILKQKQKEEVEEEEENDDFDFNVDRLEIPILEKKKGGEAFKKQDYEQAIKHYAKALMAFNFIIKEELIKDQEQMIQYIETIQVPCNINISICYYKLKAYSTAETYASTALELDEVNVKAFYRRGMCRIYQQKFAEAKSDLKQAFNLEPTNKEVMSAFELLMKERQKSQDKMKKMSQKIVGEMQYASGEQPSNGKQQVITNIYKIKNLLSVDGVKGLLSDGINKLKDFVAYNSKIMLLTPLNFATERFCKRKIPSQFYKKKQQ